MTSATHELLHFRFAKALHYNPLIYLLSALLLLDLAVAINANDLLIKTRKVTIWILFPGFAALFILRLIQTLS